MPFDDDNQLNDELPLFGEKANNGDDDMSVALHHIRGAIKRVVYERPDGQYSVFRLTDSHGNEQTIVGAMPGLMEGQEIEAEGRWERHQEHGNQVHVTSYQAVLPSSEAGIRKYLASGVLPGIGEVYADRIVDKFGLDTLNILDNYTERLKEVPGIGAKRIAEIRDAWHSQSEERGTRVFLQGLGLTPAFCNRVIRTYGIGSAAEIVRRNPYRLAEDVDGIGFLTADRIAAKMDIKPDDPLRLCAGVVHALDEASQDGHVCLPKSRLVETAAEVLNVSQDRVEQGLTIALSENKVIQEAKLFGEKAEPCFYPRWLYIAEVDLAQMVNVILRNGRGIGQPLPYERLGVGFARLNRQQRQAVEWAFAYGFSIITGGPGVGKTTVIGQIVACAKLLGRRMALAAPTGRAAKRLGEATGQEAQTIHRLLKWDVQSRKFFHDMENPLPCDLLIVDEVSMLDTPLADNLFKAVRPGTSVVLVGDKDQLPSVGPGAVLHDLIASRKIAVTELTEIYRQADGSRIVTNAHLVNEGRMPDLRPVPQGVKADFYWVEQADTIRAADLICKLIVDRIPKVFGYTPMNDVQVLSPMRKGDCGTLTLNSRLQAALNPADGVKESFQVGGRMFRTGDRVMQTRNNYDKGVFNGEMGRVLFVDNSSKNFTVQFDSGVVEYSQLDCDQLMLAYAVTVHKSQGSEFPVVIMPVMTQHFIMLQRNLIYTGMTRAKKLLIMIGTRRALNMALRNDRPSQRETGLTLRLMLNAF